LFEKFLIGYHWAVEDLELLAQMLGGDEKAFTELVARYNSTLIRVARYYVGSDASAEDVAQETWIAVIRGVSSFEGRSTFKTWLFHILVNRARSVGSREHRMIAVDPNESNGLAPSRFDQGGMWREPPVPFTDVIENGMVNQRIVQLVREAISLLPEPQQAVVTLRDVEGLSTKEVADLLELSEANARVILHRGRTRVRADVESKMKERET
jgi:RNA polymerase sigma-70 factor (ECF subfamily)